MWAVETVRQTALCKSDASDPSGLLLFLFLLWICPVIRDPFTPDEMILVLGPLSGHGVPRVERSTSSFSWIYLLFTYFCGVYIQSYKKIL